MSTETRTNHTTKDIYDVCQQSADRLLDTVKQSVPRYCQSVTNAQQEYVDACENMVNSGIAFQKEFAKRTGIATSVPDATLKTIRGATEEYIKAASIQNQIVLAAIDSTQQNIKAFNDNAKSLADLNKNILQSWISMFTASRN